jgi:hypothetical protein
MASDRHGAFGLVEPLQFVAPVSASFVHLIANGELNSVLVKQMRRHEARGGRRTTTSTASRITGTPGEEEAA